jgi:hypothetical protein
VTCPESVPTKEGHTFECTVVFEGGAVWPMVVTQLGQGRTRWMPRGQAVFADDIEPWLTAALEERGQRAQVRCSERVYVVDPGEPIACTGVVGGHASVLNVTIDAAGAMRMGEPDVAPGPAPDEGPGAPPAGALPSNAP